MAAPETITRAAIKGLLETTFPGVPIRDDKLHGSLGAQGAVIGTSPIRARPWNRDAAVQDTEVLVQFYNKYTLKVDPTQAVDPAIVEDLADKFRLALKGGYKGSGAVWYFMLVDITYPDDPTGNKTRFEARVVAKGNNDSLIETS